MSASFGAINLIFETQMAECVHHCQHMDCEPSCLLAHGRALNPGQGHVNNNRAMQQRDTTVSIASPFACKGPAPSFAPFKVCCVIGNDLQRSPWCAANMVATAVYTKFVRLYKLCERSTQGSDGCSVPVVTRNIWWVERQCAQHVLRGCTTQQAVCIVILRSIAVF